VNERHLFSKKLKLKINKKFKKYALNKSTVTMHTRTHLHTFYNHFPGLFGLANFVAGPSNVCKETG